MRYPESYDTTLSAWVDRMKKDHLAPRTISFYKETIHAVVRILEQDHRPFLPRDIRRCDLDYLLDYMEECRFAVQTRKGYIQALRKWVWSFDGDLMHEWPRIRYPHDKRPCVDWLSSEDAHYLLWYPDKTPMQEAVIHMELCMGLRRIEVIRLRIQDINWDGQYLNVTGKGPGGGSPRLVPFNHDTETVLRKWMAQRQCYAAESQQRFPVHADIPEQVFVWYKAGKLHPYSEEGYGLDKAVIAPLNDMTGLTFSNHTLRRTFGRALFRAGIPVPTIARILGHESTSITLRYIGVDLDDMRGAMSLDLYGGKKE